MTSVYQTAATELYTIRDYIRWAATLFASHPLFYGHGTDNAWDEAISLVLPSLQIPYEQLETVLDARLTLEEKQRLLQLIQQRCEQRIPVPYLTHQANFAGLTFYIDERALIPRSPIAELIEQKFSPWIAEEQIHRVLDLCTGSGCIAIAAAWHLDNPDILVDAVDISSDALAVAEKNVTQFQLEAQVELIQSDLFTQLHGRRYDVIVSNPPYVDAAEMAALPAEYNAEPPLALAAGDDGLAIVHQILAQAPNYLTDHGILIVEVGASAEALIAAYPDLPFIWLDFERGGEGIFLLHKADLL